MGFSLFSITGPSLNKSNYKIITCIKVFQHLLNYLMAIIFLLFKIGQIVTTQVEAYLLLQDEGILKTVNI